MSFKYLRYADISSDWCLRSHLEAGDNFSARAAAYAASVLTSAFRHAVMVCCSRWRPKRPRSFRQNARTLAPKDALETATPPILAMYPSSSCSICEWLSDCSRSRPWRTGSAVNCAASSNTRTFSRPTAMRRFTDSQVTKDCTGPISLPGRRLSGTWAMRVPTESRSPYVSRSLRRVRCNALLRIIRGAHDLGILRKVSGLLRNVGTEPHAHVDEHEGAIQDVPELKLRCSKCGT